MGGSVKKSDTIRLGLIALNAFPEDLAEATAAAKAEAIVEAKITDADNQDPLPKSSDHPSPRCLGQPAKCLLHIRLKSDEDVRLDDGRVWRCKPLPRGRGKPFMICGEAAVTECG